MPIPPPGPLIHAITFAYPDASGAVPLRGHKTDALIWDTPEWLNGVSVAPAAFTRGTQPTIKVVFRVDPVPVGGTVACVVSAHGEGGPGISPTQVELRIDAEGRSQPVALRLDAPLQNVTGVQQIDWQWYADLGAGPQPAGVSSHEVFLTWRAPLETATWDDESHLRGRRPTDLPWVYVELARWTSTWAAGLDGEKAICDAIIARVAESKLRYGVRGWHVREMLQVGGGMCAGWYRMFQAMAAAQGVHVERRKYMVDWRAIGADVAWCALVVRKPGLNQSEPTDAAATFHDVVAAPLTEQPVTTCTERRYQFWGHLGRPADGHCINFLQVDGQWFVYDACFWDQAIPLEGFTLPAPDRARAVDVDVADLGTFRSAYLEPSVNFMLGSWENRGKRYATIIPAEGDVTDGLSVKTTIIPRWLRPSGPVVYPQGWAGITFYWDT